jgi:hypothetical protein
MSNKKSGDRSPISSHNAIHADQSVDNKLTSYLVAAAAAGVGILALAPPVAADVVYTPAHIRIPRVFSDNGAFRLDLNHDGIVDFALLNFASAHGGALQVGAKVPGNRIIGGSRDASVLHSGATIGPSGPFVPEAVAGLETWRDSSGIFFSSGPWKNTVSGYLGLRFLIQGEYHFGWARLNTQGAHMVLTGYAYETVANQPILAGQTQDADRSRVVPEVLPSPHQQQATLGVLAQGASGLQAWRKREQLPSTD